MSEVMFYNGKIITMTEKNAEAVLVKDGRIKAVGTMDEVMAEASENIEKADLQGKCLMPSFIDGHSHLTQFAQSLLASNLSGCKSFDDIIDTLTKFKKMNDIGPGEHITGFGYDHNNLAEKSHPTKEMLDKAFPDNPVVLSHVSGHVGVANSLTLKKVGYDKNTKAPDGGVIGKYENGELNGYLEENAFFALRKHMPAPSADKLMKLLRKAQEIYLSYGITTIQDGMLDERSFGLLKAASDNNELICDVVGYGDMKQCPDLLNNNSEYTEGKYINRLKLGGYKIFLDGSPQGRTAWMRKPYLKTAMDSRDNYSGYPIYTDEQVKAYADRAIAENRQLIAHCNGDAAAVQYIGAFEKHTDTRPVIIHGQFLPKERLPEVKTKGMMPSYFIAHTYYWGDVHIENMGMERAKDISPANSTAKLKIPFTFHQDTPVLPPNEIETIWCAVNRETKNGVKLNQEECVSVYDALKAVTINSAYGYFEENEKGSLEEGKFADLVILSESPLDIPKENIRDIKVLATYKEGRKLFEA